MLRPRTTSSVYTEQKTQQLSKPSGMPGLRSCFHGLVLPVDTMMGDQRRNMSHYYCIYSGLFLLHFCNFGPTEKITPPPTVTPVALIWRFIQNLYALLTYRPDLNSMNMLQLHSLIAGIKYLTIQHIWRMHQHFLTDLKTWLPWIWSHTADWDFHVILMWNIGCFTYSCFSCTSSTAAFLQSNQMADKLQ